MTDILQEASELINGERAKTYGPVTENFQRIADLFVAYIGVDDVPLTLDSYDVANLMILVKLARIKNAGYHRDSYADIAGYAALAEKVHDEETYQGPTYTLTLDNTPEPRVWDRLGEVPFIVKVKDNAGDIWEARGLKWGYTFAGNDEWNEADPEVGTYDAEDGPFTEVLEEN
jgi:hypothetical protein